MLPDGIVEHHLQYPPRTIGRFWGNSILTNTLRNEFFNFAISMFQSRSFEKMDELIVKKDMVVAQINEIIKHRIKILKKTQKGSKVSITYIDMLTETKNLVQHVVQLTKATSNMSERSN